MRWEWEVVSWAALALTLFAAEALVPGAFMLWLGFAAAAVFVLVLLVADVPVLAQVAVFIGLSFLSVQLYRTRFRSHERPSDRPTLNRRADQLLGQVVPLVGAIVNGQGRVQIADAFWTVNGPELPLGAAVRIVGSDGMALRVEPVE